MADRTFGRPVLRSAVGAVAVIGTRRGRTLGRPALLWCASRRGAAKRARRPADAALKPSQRVRRRSALRAPTPALGFSPARRSPHRVPNTAKSTSGGVRRMQPMATPTAAVAFAKPPQGPLRCAWKAPRSAAPAGRVASFTPGHGQAQRSAVGAQRRPPPWCAATGAAAPLPRCTRQTRAASGLHRLAAPPSSRPAPDASPQHARVSD